MVSGVLERSRALYTHFLEKTCRLLAVMCGCQAIGSRCWQTPVTTPWSWAKTEVEIRTEGQQVKMNVHYKGQGIVHPLLRMKVLKSIAR